MPAEIPAGSARRGWVPLQLCGHTPPLSMTRGLWEFNGSGHRVVTFTMLIALWERIWEQNAAKLLRRSGMSPTCQTLVSL
jgi:hypothetical protein